MRSNLHGKAVFGILAVTLGLVSSSVFAQTARKVRPLATPPPVLTGAEIISRAIDANDGPIVIRPDGKPADPVAESGDGIKELRDRIRLLESGKKPNYDDKQKRMLMNLDILTRAEARSESLRKQMFEMIEKENSLKSRLEQIEFDIRPEMIERTLQMAGSMKPEEIRDNRRKSLAAERLNLQGLVSEIQTNRANLSNSLTKSDIMVDRLRTKLEKDIDDSFLREDDPIDP